MYQSQMQLSKVATTIQIDPPDMEQIQILLLHEISEVCMNSHSPELEED